MSFEIVLTQSAQEIAERSGVLPVLEQRARGEIAELPGEGLEELERRLFHAFALGDGTEVICSLTADGAVRVDACEAEAAA
ncbi:Halobacterial output domain-containing protein [Methylorubrum thiocyanatum]